MPDASLHNSGSISFGSQKKKMEEETGAPVSYTEVFNNLHKHKTSGEFVSQKSKEAAESYEKQMVECYGDDLSQHPQFDAAAWLSAAGQPKKGRFYGFGGGMDAGGIISSFVETRCSAAASYSFTQPSPPPPPPSQLPADLNDQYCNMMINKLDSWFDQRVVPALHAMGVVLPHPPPTAGSDHVVENGDETDDDGAHLADD